MKRVFQLWPALIGAAAYAGPTTVTPSTEAALAENLALARVLTVRPSSKVQQLDGAQQDANVVRDDVRMGGRSCVANVAPLPPTPVGRGSKLLGTTNVTVVQRAPTTIKC